MMDNLTRREALAGVAAIAGRTQAASGGAGFRGYFPILQTPFTSADHIDQDAMKRQVAFCLECGARGLVWPQLLSEFQELSEKERLATAEVILEAAAGRAPVVIGVQAPAAETALRLAKHAAGHGAAALISLPPYTGKPSPEDVRRYFVELAAAVELPVFLQNTGGQWGPAMAPELVISLARENPRLAHIKEEAPQILPRFEAYVRSGVMRSLFSGAGGKYFFLEQAHGVGGSMGPAALTDVVSRLYDLHAAGELERARALQGDLVTVMVMEYLFGGVGLAKEILVRRGIFTSARQRKRGREMERLTEAGGQELNVWLRRMGVKLPAS